MKKVRILVINDIHDGSIHAICSDDPIAEGKHIKPNRSQRVLLKGWKKCCEELKDNPPDIIVINGEPIDGNNKKGFSKELWSQEAVDQVRDFVKLFNMIPQKKYTKTYLTRGSSYHVDIEGTPIEEFIGDYIGAETYQNLKSNYHLQMRVNGKLISFAHETGYSKNLPARGNRLVAEYTTHAATVDSKDRWNLSVRAHVHQIVERGIGTVWKGISCPAWKHSLGDYFERHGPHGTPSDIGMTVIEVDEKGKISYEFLIPEGVKLENRVIDFE